MRKKSCHIHVGERYGDIEVIEDLGIDKTHHHKYLCLCHICGARIKVDHSTVFSSVSQSGCKECRRAADLTDRVIGTYRFIAPVAGVRDNQRRRLWVARCEKCGRERLLSSKQAHYIPSCICSESVSAFSSDTSETDIDKLLLIFQRDIRIKDDRIRQLQEEQANITRMCEQFKSAFNI
ncbi:MAG: hypothetical protein Q4G33_12455 [bacterium]|nr:hypothetical protein [bacterium]